jgi:hypothetical protein
VCKEVSSKVESGGVVSKIRQRHSTDKPSLATNTMKAFNTKKYTTRLIIRIQGDTSASITLNETDLVYKYCN